MAHSVFSSYLTRGCDNVLLIGYPLEHLTGARLPSGRDVMRNFVFYHLTLKKTVKESAQLVYDQLMPFWLKSRLPTRRKDHIIKKVTDLYKEHCNLMKNAARGNEKDLENQEKFSRKLDNLFDISHAASDQLIHIEEDKEFLKLQQQSRIGVIGSVDKKRTDRERRAIERKLKTERRVQFDRDRAAENEVTTNISDSSGEDKETESDEYESSTDKTFTASAPTTIKRQKTVLSTKLAATLDRTNTSVRNSTMILASVINEAGDSSLSHSLSSKSTVHRHRQSLRKEAAENIKQCYEATKSVVHWDGKLIPDVTGSAYLIDRLPVLVTSTVDGDSKLLGVSALLSGTGRDTAAAVHQQLESWHCDPFIIGLCFDTTASNTGRHSGACQLLENALNRNLLWLACRHHMHEILLSDVFTVCFGPSSGPEVIFFKRFRDKWDSLLSHQPKLDTTPLISASDSLKSFINDKLTQKHPRDDYLELLQLAGYMVGLKIEATVRRPGAIHRARWMAKALYTLKIELLYEGNEKILQLTGRQLQATQRFNRFVVEVYIQAWFSCRATVDAPSNDIQLINRLKDYSDEAISKTGLKMMARHSWYLSPEMATVAIFSSLLSNSDKQKLVDNIISERGPHLITDLPHSVADLHVSRTFFETTACEDSFLSAPVEEWPGMQSFEQALSTVTKLPCVNDCAERGVALIEKFNTTTKDETQKQYLLQVVEQHRKTFCKLTSHELANI